jgi:hypothetical protein
MLTLPDRIQMVGDVWADMLKAKGDLGKVLGMPQ